MFSLKYIFYEYYEFIITWKKNNIKYSTTLQ